MATTLAILHGLVAVALLGAITHQTLAVWAPSGVPPRSFFGRFRAVPSAAFANAIIILYLITALLGAVVYLYFKVHIQPDLERDRHWSALGLLELKEDFLAIGLGLLPAYWVCWRRPLGDERGWARAALNRCPCVRHLVGLSRRSHHERHHGFRVVMSVPAFSRFAFAYGIAFGLLYVVARLHGLALFTVYPSLGVVLLGMHRSRDVADPAMAFLAPEMWWYGWVASAALGAFVIGLVATLLPDRWWRGFWPGWVWVTPLIAMIGCVYLTIPWFRQ